jgi:hypothetical protein
VNRNRLLATAVVLAIAVLGQAGIATAEDQQVSPTAVASPSGVSTTESAGAPSLAATTTDTSTPTIDSTPTADPTPAADPTTGIVTTNQVPVARPDDVSVAAGRTVTISPLSNDTDADQQPRALSIVAVTPADARLTRSGSTLTFASRSTDRGPQVFDYTVTDGQDGATARITVTVTAPPLPAPTVSIALASEVVALRTYSIHGTVNRISRGPVDVVVQQLSGGSWVRYKADRADSGGRYAVSFRTRVPRSYTFRAVATWADGKTARTGRLTRLVVARPDVVVSGPLTRAQVPYSWRAGCPVPPRSLRKITVNRFNYDHVVARGTLVVRASAVPDILTVFRASFASRFPIRSMKPTDAFYDHGRRTPTQSDLAAMRADNTSAFNCRPVTGNPYRVSQHSYGNAIDINTVRNPYVVGSRVYPDFARTYLDRSNVRTGMITRRGVIATKMRQVGWPWGARWSHPDYQHFSANGG